jgi:hypothetical protein
MTGEDPKALPIAEACRWLLLLLSRHRCPGSAPASDAGTEHHWQGTRYLI